MTSRNNNDTIHNTFYNNRNEFGEDDDVILCKPPKLVSTSSLPCSFFRNKTSTSEYSSYNDNNLKAFHRTGSLSPSNLNTDFNNNEMMGRKSRSDLFLDDGGEDDILLCSRPPKLQSRQSLPPSFFMNDSQMSKQPKMDNTSTRRSSCNLPTTWMPNTRFSDDTFRKCSSTKASKDDLLMGEDLELCKPLKLTSTTSLPGSFLKTKPYGAAYNEHLSNNNNSKKHRDNSFAPMPSNSIFGNNIMGRQNRSNLLLDDDSSSPPPQSFGKTKPSFHREMPNSHGYDVTKGVSDNMALCCPPPKLQTSLPPTFFKSKSIDNDTAAPMDVDDTDAFDDDFQRLIKNSLTDINDTTADEKDNNHLFNESDNSLVFGLSKITELSLFNESSQDSLVFDLGRSLEFDNDVVNDDENHHNKDEEIINNMSLSSNINEETKEGTNHCDTGVVKKATTDMSSPEEQLKKLHRLMLVSASSQNLLQEFDKRMGLPKNHCKTMISSNTTREQLMRKSKKSEETEVKPVRHATSLPIGVNFGA